MRNRTGVRATGDQTADVRHVGDKQRSNFAGNFGKRGKIDQARIGRCTADQYGGFEFQCFLANG